MIRICLHAICLSCFTVCSASAGPFAAPKETGPFSSAVATTPTVSAEVEALKKQLAERDAILRRLESRKPVVIQPQPKFRIETRHRWVEVPNPEFCPTCPVDANNPLTIKVKQAYTVKLWTNLDYAEKRDYWRRIGLSVGNHEDPYTGESFYWNGQDAVYGQSSSFTQPRSTGRGAKSGTIARNSTGRISARSAGTARQAGLSRKDSKGSETFSSESEGYYSDLPAEAQPTPMAEVRRVVKLLGRKPGETTFVDYGCGADARWCIEAAKAGWPKVIGVEIDAKRYASARWAVAAAGLIDRVKIIHGDSTKLKISADVGVAYLPFHVLDALRPQIVKLKRFASYRHPVEGIAQVKSGNSWIFTGAVASRNMSRDLNPAHAYQPPARQQRNVAYWDGRAYGPNYRGCGDSSCGMCYGRNGILAQLGRR